MRANVSRRLFLLALLSGAAAGELIPRVAQAESHYAATGRVVSFTADHNTVSIAHEAIPGVMGAMTMSFTARAATQLAGLSVGDRVRFTFTVTDDGRRLLDAVERVR
ncbi:MAG: copper-binding protein [Polyangiales bacterium]